MKTAFVHCWLLPGGAKNVLEQSIQQSPHTQAAIFTLISKEHTRTIENKSYQVITVFPQIINDRILQITEKNIPILSTLFDYRNLIIAAPLRSYILSKKIRKYKPDNIYISSFAWSKNINTFGIPTTLYLHSPMQYIWTHYEEYCKKITGRKGVLFKIMTPLLRKRDQKPRTYTLAIANSKYTSQEAKKLYNLTTTIQYPPIQPEVYNQSLAQEIHNYFIYSGRLVTFVKELDIIIQACNQTNTPLIVMGDGPDKIKLEKIAGNSIIFIPRIKDIYARIQVIQKAKGSINIAKESFGISTMESLLLGVPLLGYNHGATPELVDNKSGILVEDKNIETIAQSLRSRDTRSFDRNYIQEQARKIYKKYSTATQQ